MDLLAPEGIRLKKPPCLVDFHFIVSPATTKGKGATFEFDSWTLVREVLKMMTDADNGCFVQQRFILDTCLAIERQNPKRTGRCWNMADLKLAFRFIEETSRGTISFGNDAYATAVTSALVVFARTTRYPCSETLILSARTLLVDLSPQLLIQELAEMFTRVFVERINAIVK